MRDGFIKVRCFSPELKVADVKYNTEKIIDAIDNSAKKGVKILVLPELCLTGYTCADLFSQDVLIKSCGKALLEIANSTRDKNIVAFVGAPLANGNRLYNCAVCINRGDIIGVVPKTHLPNYSEFYEMRNFSEPDGSETSISVDGVYCEFGTDLLFICREMDNLIIGAEICEDLWTPQTPSEALCAMGANVICNLSASNEVLYKDVYRRDLCKMKSASLICAYLYADASEDESTTDVVFSAHNMICENGTILAESKPFANKNGDTVSEIDINKLQIQRLKTNTYDTKNPPKARFMEFDLEIEPTPLTRKFDKMPFVPENEEQKGAGCERILTMQERALAKRVKASGAKALVLGISGGLDSTLALLACVKCVDYIGWDRKNIVAVTMPCFGTTQRTKSNATELCLSLGVTLKEVNIFDSVRLHFKDIGHDENVRNTTYENAQARERTQILMDIANDLGGLCVGTGDLSEIALGWSTYNADHMSMYNPNCSIPKTLVKHIVAHFAKTADEKTKNILTDILNTPISPELLPSENGEDIAQKTEELVGPYELHDFFLYNFMRMSFAPSKIYRLAKESFKGIYDDDTIYKWLTVFIKRFFSQQFKRSCSPDGVKVGSVALSPRGDLKMPSDASCAVWLDELETNRYYI